jgi:hypothetical protein
MWFALQDAKPFIVTIAPRPTQEVSLADVLLASLGVIGVSIVVAAVVGALFAFVLIRWHRRYPPERDRLPPISPLVPDSTGQRSSQAR